MSKLIYYHNTDKEVIYLNIVEKYLCTNDCLFCDKKEIELCMGDLYLEKRPTLQEILSQIDREININHPQEAVFCGIAEPTLRLGTMTAVIQYLKDKYKLHIRLNTNGHGTLINPGKNVPRLLKEGGLDSVIVSLNATTKEQYDYWHRPHNKEKAFPASLEFAKACQTIGLETKVSFLDLPDFDLDKINEFVLSLGLREDQIRLRYLFKN